MALGAPPLESEETPVRLLLVALVAFFLGAVAEASWRPEARR